MLIEENLPCNLREAKIKKHWANNAVGDINEDISGMRIRIENAINEHLQM